MSGTGRDWEQDLAPRTTVLSDLLPSGRLSQPKFTEHTKIALSRGPNFLTQGPESHFTFCQTHRASFGRPSATSEAHLSPFPCSLPLSLLPWFPLVMTDDVVVGLPSHKLDYSSVVSLKFAFKKVCVFCLQVLVGGFLRN